MKTLLAFIITLLTFIQSSFAGSGDERKISKGTIFNYNIKDGVQSYKLKATVIECNPEGNIRIQWQTTGTKPMKGISTLPYSSLESASEMKIKLKPGNETLTEDITRWFVGYDAYDYLYNLEMEADMKIDDLDLTLYPDTDETEKEILYNNVKTEMDYAQGTNSTEGIQTFGLIEYADKVVILGNYEKGKFSMKLVSIQSPVSKSVRHQDEAAKQILESIAPKGEAPLKKMGSIKFALVKSAYPVLASIEDYEPLTGSSVSKPIVETYEYRYNTGAPNPPSLVDCFTADLKIIYNQRTKLGVLDLNENIDNNKFPEAVAEKLLDVYTTTDYNRIPGYRPWTHWSFVTSLSAAQKKQLGAELEGYISRYGFSE